MKNWYKKMFSLTEEGAKGLQKASIASFGVYCVNMMPAMILMLMMNALLLKNVRSPWLYAGISLFTLIIMYWLLAVEYESVYNATYKESAHLRIGIAETLADLPLSYFSKHDLSDLSQTIMSDVESIEHAMSHSMPKISAMAMFFPLVSLLLLIGNWKLGLAVVLPTLFSLIMIPISKKIQIKGHNKYHAVLRENSEAFQEAIEMQQEIKSFHLCEENRQALYQKMEHSEKVHIKSELMTILSMSASSLFAYVSLAVVVVVGVHLLAKGEASLLYVLGYLLAAMKIKDGLDASKEGILEVFHISPCVRRIREIKEAKTQEGKDTKLRHFDISLEHVSFFYDEDTPVLEDVSFVAKQDEVTALVGASGCGKTSILRLVSRLYDYQNGKICIDGKDIKGISTNALFDKIAIVFQDVTLFNSSVMENIRIGRQSASDEEVKEAARLANCTEFIEKLENGFATKIGENGAELSGGERQRLSIARAFLKDAPILILDEIAASLDVDNEKKIQESLNQLIKNKTVIIISHRLKSIENVDKIVVLDKGKVESMGRHDELLQKSAIYRNLIEKTKMAEEFVY